ncbi:hypothetical protein J6590_068313 [Homalodisca vitripennis]|nr:hypothetical protein J6590_068313 [Homalodisca vitripennis]
MESPGRADCKQWKPPQLDNVSPRRVTSPTIVYLTLTAHQYRYGYGRATGSTDTGVVFGYDHVIPASLPIGSQLGPGMLCGGSSQISTRPTATLRTARPAHLLLSSSALS